MQTKLTRSEIKMLKDDSHIEEWMRAMCPLCMANNYDSTRYAPQQLFDHLRGRAHTKEDLADFLQEEQTTNHTYDKG